MKAIDIVHLTAGMLVMAGVLLSIYVHPYWLALPAFVGLNLFQFSFSGFCPLIWVLKRLGIQE